jgi:hypothetical protein
MPGNSGFKPRNSYSLKKRGRPPKIAALDEFLLQNTDSNGHATSPDWKLAEMATESFGIECGETTIWKHRSDLKIEPYCDWGGARGRLDLLRPDPGLSRDLDYRYETQKEMSKWLDWHFRFSGIFPFCKIKGSSDADLAWFAFAQTFATFSHYNGSSDNGVDHVLKSEEYGKDMKSMIRRAYRHMTNQPAFQRGEKKNG